MAGQVQANNLVALFKLITKELAKIQKGKVTKQELDAIKAYEWGSFQKSLQTVSALADWYQYAYFVGGVIKEYPAVEDQILSVTPVGMRKIVDKLFQSEVWGLGIMSSTKSSPQSDEVEQLLFNSYRQ